MQFVDIGDEWRSSIPHVHEEAITNADVICVLVDLTNPEALAAAKLHVTQIKKKRPEAKPPILLIGTKLDQKRVLSRGAVVSYSLQSDITYIETSAKDLTGLRDDKIVQSPAEILQTVATLGLRPWLQRRSEARRAKRAKLKNKEYPWPASLDQILDLEVKLVFEPRPLFLPLHFSSENTA